MKSITHKNKNLILRQVVDNDIPQIRILVNEAYKELADQGLNYTATYQDEAVTSDRIKKGRGFVLIENQKIIATILLTTQNYFTNRNTAYISQFAVSPVFKKMGLGSILMRFCEELSKNEGFDAIQLDTAKPAVHLVNWYLKLGYKIVGEEQWLEKTYSSYIFEKSLK